MKLIYKTLLVVSLMLLFNGCATVGSLLVNASLKHSILVNTYPANSEVIRNGKSLGTTPCLVKVSRWSKAPLELQSDGYETKVIPLHRRFNGTTCYNVLIFYAFPIDIATGCIYTFKETSIVESIVPLQSFNFVERVDKIKNLKANDSILLWEDSKQLKIEDFKKVLAQKSKLFSAWTSVWNTCQYSLKDTTAKIRILSCFNKNTSYFNNKVQMKKRLLRHEQMHFNIQEIAARKIRKRIKESKFDYETIETELNKILNEEFIACNAMQANYDNEVYAAEVNIFKVHNQFYWNKLILRKLEALSDYSQNDITIKLR